MISIMKKILNYKNKKHNEFDSISFCEWIKPTKIYKIKNNIINN